MGITIQLPGITGVDGSRTRFRVFMEPSTHAMILNIKPIHCSLVWGSWFRVSFFQEIFDHIRFLNMLNKQSVIFMNVKQDENSMDQNATRKKL